MVNKYYCTKIYILKNLLFKTFELLVQYDYSIVNCLFISKSFIILLFTH